MKTTPLLRIKTISEYHHLMKLPAPEHPLISVIDLDVMKRDPQLEGEVNLIFDFYSVSLKRNPGARYKYGQQQYDFEEGIMFFMAPGQVFGVDMNKASMAGLSGYMLFIHPDFLWSTPLAQKIRSYEYFSYAVHEALHLSEKEERTIIGMMQNMEQEYRSNIDRFSQDVIIAQLELLLTYSERFYQRQFITRKISNHLVLARLEEILETHFGAERAAAGGLPTVQHISKQLHVSPGYLSSLLKTLTGRNTQEHIHHKLIEKAKAKLSTTELSVSEIAYELGFEHPQSFSRLFKTKTSLSPLAFRQSFN